MYYLIGLITGIVFYGFLAWMLMRRQIASGARRLRNLPRSAQALIAVVAIIATVEAQKSGTNGTNNASGGTNLMMNAGHNLPHPSLINHAGFPVMLRGTIGETTSQQEIDLGYRYAYTTNDADHSFAMPTNAVYLGNAHVHGARSDFGRNVVNLGDWSFPFGSNDVAYSTFWYFIEGYYSRKSDFPYKDKHNYRKYIVPMIGNDSIEIVFYKSKKSDRWWMEIPCPEEQQNKYARHLLLPCSIRDYQQALNNEIPERWWTFYNRIVE